MPKEKSLVREVDESLSRLTAVDQHGADDPVHLTEDQDTGDRFLLYSTGKGVEVQLRYEGDDLWMTQAQLADLFGVTRPNVTMHITNIYEEGELDRAATCKEILQVRFEGERRVNRPTNLYNLDAIIAVGYRVSTRQGTMFRKWATEKLVQFATKGFVVDTERLKDPENYDHFKELREIIREIRASEANVYKEVRAICALCSDYDVLSDEEKNAFFATIQNKLHYAVTGMTGAEIRMQRADARKPQMGLTHWKGAHPTQADIMTAKNFLGQAEIRDLNRFTNMLLDYFEQETDLKRLVTMRDAEAALDKFVRNNERLLLRGKGSISKRQADDHVKHHYQLFNEQRKRLAQSDDVD